MLCCANAAGYAIPPLVIFKRQNLLPSLTVGQVPGTAYGLNAKSGWINGEICRDWYHKHFLLHAPAARPLLLLLDGHFEPDFIREAASQGVIVFALPPNTTHVCQPLDSTCFRSLKLHWGNACSEYLAANPGKIVTIYQFSKLLQLPSSEHLLRKLSYQPFVLLVLFHRIAGPFLFQDFLNRVLLL